MTESILMLLIAAYLAPVVAACGRGERWRGPSWFEIPRPANRAARRGR